MKVKFLRDFGPHKKGEEKEVSPRWATSYGLRQNIVEEVVKAAPTTKKGK